MEFKLNNVYSLLKTICDEIGYTGISINYSNKDNNLSLTLWSSNKKDNIEITEKYLDTELNEQEVNDIIEWLKQNKIEKKLK